MKYSDMFERKEDHSKKYSDTEKTQQIQEIKKQLKTESKKWKEKIQNF